MAADYQKHSTVTFANRRLPALEAGQATGGAKRGRQSSALYI